MGKQESRRANLGKKKTNRGFNVTSCSPYVRRDAWMRFVLRGTGLANAQIQLSVPAGAPPKTVLSAVLPLGGHTYQVVAISPLDAKNNPKDTVLYLDFLLLSKIAKKDGGSDTVTVTVTDATGTTAQNVQPSQSVDTDDSA